MRIYLDLCCFNRPYDDQERVRIRLETEAKLALSQKVREDARERVRSSILDHANSRNPFEERSRAIRQWRDPATAHVMAEAEVIERTTTLVKLGITEWDAGMLHRPSSPERMYS